MVNPNNTEQNARIDLANRLFFRLYQCTNMLHKTGTRAVEEEGLTTQQWAVLGALSRPSASEGMNVGDLAKYLKVSRQNLSGVLSRMERDGNISLVTSTQGRRSKIITMTTEGRRVWEREALPKIKNYYEAALVNFSTNDLTHMVHYLLKLLGNMESIDSSEEILEE